MRDCFGTEILVGDVVIMAVSISSKERLWKGEVTELTPKKVKVLTLQTHCDWGMGNEGLYIPEKIAVIGRDQP